MIPNAALNIRIAHSHHQELMQYAQRELQGDMAGLIRNRGAEGVPMAALLVRLYRAGRRVGHHIVSMVI
jgi:hypothetical protein